MLFLVRTAMGFQFQSVASAAPFLTVALGIGYAEIGSLIGLYMLPGVVMALPGGLLGRFIGDKQICAAGLALMIAGGVIFALGDSYGTVVAGRVASGTGAVLFSLVITKMLTDWFAGREIVTAMAVMLASWPFGIATALVAQTPLALRFGWPAVMWATVLLCAVALLLVLALYRAPPAAVTAPVTSAPGRLSGAFPLNEALPVAAAGAMWGLFNVGLSVFFSFTPVLLAEQGFSLVAAGGMVSLGLWVSMPALPLGGWLTERSGRPGAAIVLLSAATGIVLLLLTLGSLPALLCLLVGLGIGAPAGAIMALPAAVLAPERRALGFGLFYTIYYIAMALGPALAGWCRDHWHTASAALVFGAAAYGAILPLFALYQLWLSRRPLASRDA